MSAEVVGLGAALPWDCGGPAGATPLTSLDRAFARFLQQRVPSPDPRHAWLAALASHQYGRGHACLDLAALAAAPGLLLAWEPAALAALPPDLAAAAGQLPWLGSDPSGAAPLVLAGRPGARRLYLRRAWAAEQRILGSLAQRCRLPIRPPEGLEALLALLFPKRSSNAEKDWQRIACDTAARQRLTLITGGPGTGKTTTVVRLLAVLAADARRRGQPFTARLAAPTGKAAARLQQSIATQLAQLPAELAAGVPQEAVTLHRLLGLRDDTRDLPAAPLVADLVVVDEASMIDLALMARLLDAVPVTARLVLLGDRDQLASVEAGAVLAQLCDRADLQDHIVTLRNSHRFAAQGGVGRWADRINAGDAAAVLAELRAAPAWFPASTAPGLSAAPVRRLVLRAATDPAFAACVRQGWADWLALLDTLGATGQPCGDAQALALLDAFARFQVLCALRAGPWGTAGLNLRIARALGFTARDPWYAGRPVLVTRNDYGLGLMNGDVGLALPRGGAMRVAFRDAGGRLRWVLPSRLEEVETVFAMTVHKSQGSEFRELLLVLPDTPSPLLTRELLYTGVTRAMAGLTLLVPAEAVLRAAVVARVQRSGGLAEESPGAPPPP